MVEAKSRCPLVAAYGIEVEMTPKTMPPTRPTTSGPSAPPVVVNRPSSRPRNTPSHAPETTPPPMTLRPGEPTEHALDLHQIDADDGHVLHRELPVGQVVDRALRLGVGRVRADRPARRRRRQRLPPGDSSCRKGFVIVLFCSSSDRLRQRSGTRHLPACRGHRVGDERCRIGPWCASCPPRAPWPR